MTIDVLSWNLAMFERSAEAPEDWSVPQTEAAVRDLILKRAPALVAFQELPGQVPWVETHDMLKSNPRTHSGNLAVLARHDLLEPAPLFGGVGHFALLAHFGAIGLTIANIHLAPGRAAAEERREQIEHLMRATDGRRVLVIGDTNTRVDEIDAIADIGLIAPELPYPTWDGRRNRFRGDSGRFNAYFTRLFHTADLTVSSIEVLTEPVEDDGRRFHLSDHYPLLVSIEDPAAGDGGRST